MHQHKDWKTNSKFAHLITNACPDLDGILACRTDGEKATINEFQRHFRFATFLRCFLHVKDNIARELVSRGLTGGIKEQYLSEIFGKLEGSTKYYGLVDCDNEDEFDNKLNGLKEKWNEREGAQNNSKKLPFYEWFHKEKVCILK